MKGNLDRDRTLFSFQRRRLTSSPSSQRPNFHFLTALCVFRAYAAYSSRVPCTKPVPPEKCSRGMVPKWNAWTQSSTPHSPAAGYLLSRGRALMHDRLLENTGEYVVRNVEIYHRQFRPLYRYAGRLQDNG